MKEFSSKELGTFNGKDGRPIYFAYKGKVYDVSDSDLWMDGEHQFMHLAGMDLSNEILDAPHEEEVFERFPVVGTLKAD